MTIKMSEERFSEARDNYSGFCTVCGVENFEVEPDARNYCCDDCGAYKVFGVEELLIMGEIEIC
jgi:hypothetical protein